MTEQQPNQIALGTLTERQRRTVIVLWRDAVKDFADDPHWYGPECYDDLCSLGKAFGLDFMTEIHECATSFEAARIADLVENEWKTRQ